MCFVSLVMDHYREQWEGRLNQTGAIGTGQAVTFTTWPPQITLAEVGEFKALLDRARDYDKRTGQPNCELDEKRQALKRIATQLGVEIAFL